MEKFKVEFNDDKQTPRTVEAEDIVVVGNTYLLRRKALSALSNGKWDVVFTAPTNSIKCISLLEDD